MLHQCLEDSSGLHMKFSRIVQKRDRQDGQCGRRDPLIAFTCGSRERQTSRPRFSGLLISAREASEVRDYRPGQVLKRRNRGWVRWCFCLRLHDRCRRKNLRHRSRGLALVYEAAHTTYRGQTTLPRNSVHQRGKERESNHHEACRSKTTPTTQGFLGFTHRLTGPWNTATSPEPQRAFLG